MPVFCLMSLVFLGVIIDPARLVAARESARLSREALAVACGVGYNAVQAYELGRSDPSARVLIRMARVLGVPAEDLCRGRDDEAVLR